MTPPVPGNQTDSPLRQHIRTTPESITSNDSPMQRLNREAGELYFNRSLSGLRVIQEPSGDNEQGVGKP